MLAVKALKKVRVVEDDDVEATIVWTFSFNIFMLYHLHAHMFCSSRQRRRSSLSEHLLLL